MTDQQGNAPEERTTDQQGNALLEMVRLLAGGLLGVFIGPMVAFLVIIGVMEWTGYPWLGMVAGLLSQFVFALISLWLLREEIW